MMEQATALAAAASALEQCAIAYDCPTAWPDALAKAAVIAYLNFTGRGPEAEAVRNVGT